MADASKPIIVYMGTPPPGINPLLVALSDRFTVLHYKPESLDALLATLDNSQSPIYTAAAILRLGTQASTGIPLGWTGPVAHISPSPPHLKLLINLGHGLEKEDVEGASKRGITVRGTAGGVDATATVGLYLTIAAFRHLSAAERAARSGKPSLFLGAMYRAADASVDPQGKIVGIIGYGRIGKRIGDLLRALGMRVCWLRRSDRRDQSQHQSSSSTTTTDNGDCGSLKDQGIYTDLDIMVSQVDCVLLACPYTPETHHIINHERVRKMKPGMRIVNVARGACIEDEALIHGIETGIIHGVGLDVYETEYVMCKAQCMLVAWIAFIGEETDDLLILGQTPTLDFWTLIASPCCLILAVFLYHPLM